MGERKRRIKLRVEDNEYEDIVSYEDEYEEPDPEYMERNVASEAWGLPEAMHLSRKAADFYLLYDLELDDLDDGKFRPFLHELAQHFANYADMVVGGELRYTLGHISDADRLSDELYLILRDRLGSADRHEAWEYWQPFRRKYGTSALEWAEEAFKMFNDGGSYGGDKWAYIAEVVRKYETGEYSPLTFVDMCWSLEHNGGQFFGKLWNTYELKRVLDSNLHSENDDLSGLFGYASPGIVELYREARK
jgi:hypothetical protein